MARSNLQIKVGTYAGTGVAQSITGLGFRPDFIMIDADGTTNGVWRTKHTIGDSTCYFTNAVANFTGGITEILNDGFSIGTDVTVNTNLSNYYYMAIRGTSGQASFRTGRYVGTGADDRNITTIGVNFTPEIVFLKKDSTLAAEFKTASMTGDNTTPFNGAVAADKIQSLISNGFQVGVSSNATSAVYHFMATKAVPGAIAYGSWLGAGGSSKQITGLGFKPDSVIVHNDAAAQAKWKTRDMATTTSVQLGASASVTTFITSLDSNGFTMGSTGDTNGQNHYWVAFKEGNYNSPITRTLA